MGLSETILAAIIGALATMGTAIFQLVRNRAPEGSKPKKNRVRSLLATIALMIGCVVGGYAWSSLRAVSAKEELRTTMRAEFQEQFAALAARRRSPPRRWIPAPTPPAASCPRATVKRVPRNRWRTCHPAVSMHTPRTWVR